MAGDKGDTLRDILNGFSAMQAQLGLLPAQSGQTPMGVQLNQAPPPPPVPHPSDFALQISNQQQMMMQHTMQAAQMTRYQPPPSSPQQGGGGGGFGWGNSFAGMGAGQFNPQVANAMGGGAGVGMPNPIFSTAPQYGMYRPQGPAGGMMSPMSMRPPPIWNPLAAQMPAPHFMTQPMQNYQVMQARQSESMGMIGGAMEGGLGIGGSLIGGAMGSVFGPIGSVAGSWLGGKIGGGISNMTVGPAFDDARRGRQIQNMTAPWMVSGANLNPFTGQGMERGAATDTARQLRMLTRDHEFQRTGFNTQDVMKITQLSSDQGLLQTAQNPEDIARKVKDISKSIKALIQITGDPDVRNAIASLGQMRQLGFEGLSGQMGAVANRAAFSRMAGVSQMAMHEQYGMPGAMMAQNVGLAGSTGYAAGVAGAGIANLGIQGGALTNLQLARAGGKQGLSQLMAQAEIGAINNDVMMMAAMNKGGRGINIEDYRRAQGMSLSGAVGEGAKRMGRLSTKEMTDFAANRQEFADQLSQQMNPFERQLNMIKQVQMLRKSVGEDQLSGQGAVQMLMNPSNPDDPQTRAGAKAVWNVMSTESTYTGMIQQSRAAQRERQARERARRETQYYTPGVMTRMGRGIRDAAGGFSDLFSDPVASLMERSNRVEEDIMLQQEGGSATRRTQTEMMQTPQAKQLAINAGMALYNSKTKIGGMNYMAEGETSRIYNSLGENLRLTSRSNANQISNLAGMGQGGLSSWVPSYMRNAEASRSFTEGISQTATLAERGRNMTSEQAGAMFTQVEKAMGAAGGKGDIQNVIRAALANVKENVTGAGILTRAGSVDLPMMQRGALAGLTKQGGMSTEQAMTFLKSTQGVNFLSAMGREGYRDSSLAENFARGSDIRDQLPGVTASSTQESVRAAAEKTYEDVGLTKKGGSLGSDRDLQEVKDLFKNESPEVMQLLMAQAGMGDTSGLDARTGATRKASRRGEALLARFQGRVTDKTQQDKIRERVATIKLTPNKRRMLQNMLVTGAEDTSAEDQITKAQGAVGAVGYTAAQKEVFTDLEDQLHLEKGTLTGGGTSIENVVSALEKTGGIGKIKDKGLREKFQAAASAKGPERDTAMKALVKQVFESSSQERVRLHGGGADTQTEGKITSVMEDLKKSGDLKEKGEGEMLEALDKISQTSERTATAMERLSQQLSGQTLDLGPP